jgi:hypothetical protein
VIPKVPSLLGLLTMAEERTGHQFIPNVLVTPGSGSLDQTSALSPLLQQRSTISVRGSDDSALLTVIYDDDEHRHFTNLICYYCIGTYRESP